MVYFVSFIVYLSLGVGERAITGPFRSMENCEIYKQAITDAVKERPEVVLMKANCIKEEEV